MRIFAFVAMLFIAVTVFAVNGETVNAQSNEVKKKEQTKQVIVKVKPGDSLSKIANKHKSTYKRLFYANKKIKNPDLIYPGQKVRIPSKDEKLKKRALPKGVVAPVEKKAVSYSQPAQTEQTQQVQAPQPAPVATGSAGSGVWDQLAQCESGGNWAINTGNGYYGGLQFSLSSWQGVGGSGYPHQASKAEQIARAEILRSSGGWGHWPSCTAAMGLR